MKILIPQEHGRDFLSRRCAAVLAESYDVISLPVHLPHDGEDLLRLAESPECTGFFTTKPRRNLDPDLIQAVTRNVQTSVFWYLEGPSTFDAEKQELGHLQHFSRGFGISSEVCREISRLGTPCSLLPGAVDEAAILGVERTSSVPESAIGFVGVPKPPRVEILNSLLEEGIPLRLVGPGWGEYFVPDIVVATDLRGKDCSVFYKGVKAGLNIDEWWGRSPSGLGFRVFEILAGGIPCLTNNSRELKDFLPVNPPALQVWHDTGELVDLCRCAVQNPLPGFDSSILLEPNTIRSRMASVREAFRPI